MHTIWSCSLHVETQSVCPGMEPAPGGVFLKALRIPEAHLVCEHAGGREKGENEFIFRREEG